MNSENAANHEALEGNPFSRPFRSPDWEKWKTRKRARLWQAAALLCNISPESLECPRRS